MDLNCGARVEGFVENPLAFVAAASVVVGKAGPNTIAESAACGCPMVLTSKLPGQEARNPKLVEAAGFGVWAPSAKACAAAVGRMLDAPADEQRAARSAAYAFGDPLASTAIAKHIAQTVVGCTAPPS